jgi:hypothetical protein
MRKLLLFPVVLIAGHANAAITAYWDFDSSFNATQGGADFNLSAVNGPAIAGGGKFGSAASFTRASSQYAFTSGNVLTAGTDFSYSAWYNFGVSNITDSSRYFVLETTGANTVGSTPQAWTASIGLRDQTTGTAPDEVEVFSYGPGSAQVGITTPTANVWENIIVTFDADGGTNPSTGIYRAYLNGSLFATRDNAASVAVEGLVIGGHRDGTGRNFQGLIDEVAFFDTVLTTQQNTDLQTMTVATANPSNLKSQKV